MMLVIKTIFAYSCMTLMSFATELDFKITINENTDIEVTLWKNLKGPNESIFTKAKLALKGSENGVSTYECKATIDRDLSDKEINDLTVTVSSNLHEPLITKKYAEVNYHEIKDKRLDIFYLSGIIDVSGVYSKETDLICKITL